MERRTLTMHNFKLLTGELGEIAPEEWREHQLEDVITRKHIDQLEGNAKCGKNTLRRSVMEY